MSRRRNFSPAGLALVILLLLLPHEAAAQLIDRDGDGVPDTQDNCPVTPNSDQADEDSDGRGDLCDDCPFGPDLDNDGLCDGVDVCPVDPVNTGVVQLNAPLVSGGNVIAHKSSADGQWVVYMADQELVGKVELYSVPATGGIVTRLNPPLHRKRDVFDFEISSDGATVVYLADGDVDDRADLYSVSILGGPVVLLTGSNADSIEEFAIVPDGSRAVYRIQYDLFSVPIPGGTPQELTAAGFDFPQPGFKISPDSTWVVYIDRSPSEQGLASLALDGSDRAEYSCCNVRVADFQISSDSSRVVWQLETNLDFYTLGAPIAGGMTEIYCWQTAAPSQKETLGVTPLPLDALRVLYVCGYPQRLVSEPIEGGSQIDLDDSGIIQEITPDGSRVLYEWITPATLAPADGDLRSVPVSGGTAVTLNSTMVSGGEVVEVRATPDSQSAVYRADQEIDEKFELFGVPIIGGAVARLNGDLGSQQDVIEFDISPVSTTVAYLADEDTVGAFELFANLVTGGIARKLNEPLPGQGAIAAFSINPVGERVFYRGEQITAGVDELFAIRLDTDVDADAVPGSCDCDSGNDAVWSLPGETTALILTEAAGTTTLTWAPPTVEGSAGVSYDTLRTDRPDGFVPGSGATIVEIETDGADTSSTDSAIPTGGYFYVVRAGNPCGEGSIGCERDPVGPCP